MLIKLIIYFILGILIYRFAKSLLGGGAANRRKVQRQPADQVDDVMIKDPFCGAYFPQRKGFPLEKNGEVLQFCSEKCRHGYLEQKVDN